MNTSESCICNSESILPGRGFVKIVNAYKRGMFFVQGLSRPGVLLSIQTENKELVLPHVGMNGQQLLYVFGRNVGDVIVTGELLLCAAPNLSTALQAWYEKNRVSAVRLPVQFSIQDRAFPAYVTGLALAESDPNLGTQAFAISATRIHPRTRTDL